MRGHEAMVAFKVESWIWYSVVLTIAISRLYASPIPKQPTCAQYAHTPQPSPIGHGPLQQFLPSPMQITDENPNAAFHAVWP